MPPKRTNEYHDSKKSKKARKRQKLICVQMVNPGNDLEKECPPDLSSPQSTTEMVPLSMTIEQLLEKFVRDGNEDAARQLLTHQEIDLSTPEGGDLLWTAYALNKNEMVAMLVEHGANVNVRKHLDQRTLLHHILQGSRIESSITRNIFRLMLDNGADVNTRDGHGHSLLHYAITSCHEGSMKLAKGLLKRYARITTNRGNHLKDDIYLACKHKIELLPKLIHCQKPDKEIIGRRAAFAMEYLISGKYTDNEGAAVLRMIEKIFEFGVPVNVFDGPNSKRKMSFLDRALYQKNTAVVELLLKYGADPHRQTHIGHTTLYLATAFKDTSRVSRWFIERGVSIDAQNSDEDYPIHGACKHESLENLHLLWNLGASLNVTNSSGQTPFGMMQISKKKQKPVQHLVIKYLALQTARGDKIFEKDMFKINQHGWCKRYFDTCIKQLKKMKMQKVHSDAPYFLLLSKNMYSIIQLVNGQNFVKDFKKDKKRRANLFPDYFDLISHSFEIATKRLKVLSGKKKDLRKVFRGTLPDSILAKIAYYLCFEKLIHCNYEYFMSYHEKQENILWLCSQK